MDRLIGELAHVLSRFPESRQSRRFRRFAGASSLREAVYKKLMLQRTADSKMRAQFAHGWDTDVDFLSGYFVRRGREVQASVMTLETVAAAAKARQVILLKQLEGDIPFGTTESPQGGH